MDKKTYTNTEHGLLPEPLMSEPKLKEYRAFFRSYLLMKDAFKEDKRRYEAYLKTAIQKIEGFDLKIPLGSEGLRRGIDFMVDYDNYILPIAVPLVDIREGSLEAEDCRLHGAFTDMGIDGIRRCAYCGKEAKEDLEPSSKADEVSDVVSHPSSVGTIEQWEEPIHHWFELSYAQYLTVPRSVLQSMPVEWQKRFAQCLQQMDEAIDWRPKEGRYWVKLKDDKGRYVKDPLMDYERGRQRIMLNDVLNDEPSDATEAK